MRGHNISNMEMFVGTKQIKVFSINVYIWLNVWNFVLVYQNGFYLPVS